MNKIYYGAALYPELWDRETTEQDIKEMKKLGMNLARIGEFAWSTFEPAPNQFDFSVLTETLTSLAEHEIDVIICTPTPTPPIWLTANYPERLHRNHQGVTMVHGSRQHICTNNRYFRERAAILVEQMIAAVAQFNHVVAIQLDNEFKCHVGPCYCETCKQEWHKWLASKYGTIDTLNNAWGTAIWSQHYQSFEQVVQPVSTPFLHNSSLQQNYLAFTHAKLAEFAAEQTKVIKKISPIPVTHNSSMFFDLDNELLADQLDFISFDTYTPAGKHPGFMMNQERWRYMKNDTRRTMLLETSTSHNGHLDLYGLLHPAGYLQAESFATFASGVEAFSYWLFRGQKSGCEQPHGSIVSSWGEPTIGYQPAKQVGELIEQLRPLLESSEVMEPRVALTYSDRARSFLTVEPGEDYDYKTLVTSFYQGLLALNIERKLVPEGHNLAETELLITPYVHYISDQFLEKVIKFVAQGGIWIAGPMTGDRTEEHTWHTDSGLGALTELAGVKEMMQFPTTGSGHKGEAFGTSVELSGLSSLFTVEDDVIVHGKVTAGQAQGKAFLIERALGKGKIVMVGTVLEQNALQVVIENYAKPYMAKHVAQVAEEIVIIKRKTNQGALQYWLVNFSDQPRSLVLEKEWRELLSDKQLGVGKHVIEPFGYRVLSQK
ncbi:beta-galactosidase [Amphibacillus marinus]|uniref:Beta-galactosidase n=1 Tax=Amphibacillus marinus TaxID=872970 RepID=A0A1H8H483_9BACI|nr:beta-galactosidase [Amphibacillus marinus]SEN50819.1 beta-galactosidase [Amphibacillus marinus]